MGVCGYKCVYKYTHMKWQYAHVVVWGPVVHGVQFGDQWAAGPNK